MRLFWAGLWQFNEDDDKVSPLVTAIGTGRLPSLKKINFALCELFFPEEEGRRAMRSHHFSHASWLALAQAIADGHLLELIELRVVMTMDNEKAAQFLQALNDAFLRRLIEEGKEGGPRQAKMQVFDIQGVEDDDTASPVLLINLLTLPYFIDLQQLHLHCIGADQGNLFPVVIDYISSPFALQHKRPHLQELRFPSMDYDLYDPQPGDFVDPFVDALTIPQVAANLHSLKFVLTERGALQDLGTIYSGGGLQQLRRLNIGRNMMITLQEMMFCLKGVFQGPTRGAALEELRGNFILFEEEGYNQTVLVGLGDILAAALKEGVSPNLQVLGLENLFKEVEATCAQIDMMMAADRRYPLEGLPLHTKIICLDCPRVSEITDALQRHLAGSTVMIVDRKVLDGDYGAEWCLP